MDSKLKFVEAASRRDANISELCREYGISRQTGHKWIHRYRSGGYSAMEEKSRRPGSSPSKTGQEVVDSVLALRKKHPSWGPRTLSLVLKRELGEDGPSQATVARLLKTAGAIRKRRQPVRVWHVSERPCIEVHAPNDLWTIDFKGWWVAKNGERCEPLTVRDAMSRMVLAVVVVAKTNGEVVRRILESLFAKHGTPRAMLMDNGSPWISSRSRAGLTRLSAWLVTLGIQLHRSRPASPQDNGGHERMHRDLNELRLQPAKTRRSQQPICDRWMMDFNYIRPHQALDDKTPAEVYGRPQPRLPVVQLPIYPAGWITRRVLTNGEITLNGDRVSVGRSLIGQLVGLRYESGLRWKVLFFGSDLGVVEIAEHNLVSTELVPASRSPLKPKDMNTVTPVST